MARKATSTCDLSAPPPCSTSALIKGKRSPLLLVRWSLRDKNKAATLVSRFSELTDQLLEKVQFLSLASSVGVEFLHLERLQNNSDSIDLGFHDDASLQIIISVTEIVSKSFELDDSWHCALQNSRAAEARFATIDWSGKRMSQENCVYTIEKEPEIDPRTRNKINTLANLLHQPNEQLFCILPCSGWKYLKALEHVAYVFDVPSGVRLRPQSLLRVLGDPTLQVSLGIKFNLAYSLARSISQLHMVKWVHENF